MKKQILVVASAAMMVMMSVVPAFAQGAVTVTGGELGVSPAAITFTNVALDGTDQNTNGTTSAWTATDPTGSGFGWNVQIAASNFTAVGGRSIAVGGFKVTLATDDIVTLEGNTEPVSSVTSPAVLGNTAVKMVSAAVDTGMGSYTVLPTFTLDVPATTYAASYSSVVTVTIVSAP